MTIEQQIDILNQCICKETELYGVWAKRHGMSYNTMMVLYALDKGETDTQKQIVKEWMIPKQTVNTVIKELERKGYVMFIESGRKNRKMKLTPEGKKYTGEILEDLYRIEYESMEKMENSLRNAFIEGTIAHVNAFEEGVKNGA